MTHFRPNTTVVIVNHNSPALQLYYCKVAPSFILLRINNIMLIYYTYLYMLD